MLYDDVRSITPAEIARWRKWWPNVRRVLQGSGFPCQDLSGANPTPHGIDGTRSVLLLEALRVEWELVAAFAPTPVSSLYKHDASMSNENARACTEAIATKGPPGDLECYIVCVSQFAWCRRPRLFWLRNCSRDLGQTSTSEAMTTGGTEG